MHTTASKAPNRHDGLVSAGWQVIDTLPLDRALGAFTTAAVAAEAGVTTGSFFHHFPTAAAFADALALSLTEDDTDELHRVEDLVAALEAANVLELMRSAMVDQWRRHLADPERRTELRHELLAWTSSSRPLAEPTGGYDTVGDVLAQRVRVRQDGASSIWAHVLEGVGRTFVEPFTVERLATGLTALFYGLAIRRDIEPEAVDEELFADLVGVLVATLTKPVGSDRRLSDVSENLTRNFTLQTEASPQARSGARRRAGTRARIVAATVGMFAHGWEEVTASEIADRAGVSSQTVANAFGGVRAVAAHTFVIHVEGLRTAAARARATDPAPERVIEAVLDELAACAAADPEPARALVGERVAAAARFGEMVGTGDVRSDVDLVGPLIEPLRRIHTGFEPLMMADTLVNFVLGQVTAGMSEPADTTRLALRMVRPGGSETAPAPAL